MPFVTVGMPSARAIAVPMNAATMPTRIVTSIPMGCLPGTQQAAEYADHDADENRGDNAGDGHFSSKEP